MLFDLRPKTRREEVFDREREFSELEKSLETYPIALLLGIRRVGKSSILGAYLSERPGILIDCRELYAERGHLTRDELVKELQSRVSLLGKLMARFKFSFDLKFLALEPRELSLREVFRELNDLGERLGGFVIAFDEAQYLRFYGSRGGKELLALFAHAYDSLPNLRIILTGSEVGLLHDFLGLDDYSSPLYGRVAGEVVVEPFDRETSIEFLRQGFREAGLNVPEEEIEEAVELLDGVPGWLTVFGVEYLREGNFRRAMERTLEVARGLVMGELEGLKRRSPRYVDILRAIALGYNRWSLLRDYLAVRGTRVPDPRLYALLENLKKMNWISEKEGTYRITDPVVLTALKD
ncbi:AAA family ATPase [Thermococcus zilligii]|uniref:AAA family ATPase n=1 Tax=Thermococcus zilligii TaxID=54076 RepID=UPI00029B40C4|nr:ATP-binding protein [Thermococcus zilligii]